MPSTLWNGQSTVSLQQLRILVNTANMLHSDTSEEPSPEEERFLGASCSSTFDKRTRPQWASTLYGLTHHDPHSITPHKWSAVFRSRSPTNVDADSENDCVISERNVINTIHSPCQPSVSLHDELAALSLHCTLQNQARDEMNDLCSNDISTEKKLTNILPEGWERHEDANGAYYWHIPSGTIQRRSPTPAGLANREMQSDGTVVMHCKSPSLSTLPRSTLSPLSINDNSVHSRSSSSSSTHQQLPHSLASSTNRQNINVIGYPNTTYADQHRQRLNSNTKKKKRVVVGKGEPVAFTVKSLGWVHVPSDQLSQSFELSSHVVEECIKELSKEATEEFGFDANRRGRQLRLVLYDDCIVVVDGGGDDDALVLSHQPLNLVRVWGTTRCKVSPLVSVNSNIHSFTPSPTPLLPSSTHAAPPMDTDDEDASMVLNDDNDSAAAVYHEYFAFVARDRYSETYYKCFVYECVDTLAANVTQALNIKCDAYLHQYYYYKTNCTSTAESTAKHHGYLKDEFLESAPYCDARRSDSNDVCVSGKKTAERPKSLVAGANKNHAAASQNMPGRAFFQPGVRTSGSVNNSLADFLTPMQEPRKVIDSVRYVGAMPVPNSIGIDETNAAINTLVEQSRLVHGVVNELVWPEVLVEISPSTLAIRCADCDDDGDNCATAAVDAVMPKTASSHATDTIIECRIRYLSFLGISRDDAHYCGFVIMTPDNDFVCHVVYGEQVGNVAYLCRTVEAACTLRYQKFLDAHDAGINSEAMTPTTRQAVGTPSNSGYTNFGAKLRGLFSSSWTSLTSPSVSAAPTMIPKT